MEILIIKFIPIILLIFIGYRLKLVNEITSDFIIGMKYILLNYVIPSILFISYLKTDIKIDYFIIFIITFVMGLLMLSSVKIFRKFLPHRYSAWFLSGFENGMIGIPIFTAIWSMEILPILSLISLGNVIFVWLIYVPLLEYKNGKDISVKKTLLLMIKSPIIIAIISGMFFRNFSEMFKFDSNLILKSVLNTFSLLSNLCIPVILIIFGYSIKFEKSDLMLSIKYILIRYLVTLFIGGLAFYLINKFVKIENPIFTKLFFSYIALPPPYILPMFIKENEKEINFFTTSIIMFTFFFLLVVGIIVII